VNPFRYARAANAAEAVKAVRGEPGASFIAGGTNLLDLMKDAVETPAVLVDINALPLRAISRQGNTISIGALARMSDLARDAAVRASLPMLTQALEQSASPQLRNMASIGGNLMQRTRCPYFRDTATACNKRVPGSGCSCLNGVNRMQAVLGTSDRCIAAHASDLAVALTALDAVVHVTGPSRARAIPIANFYRLPGEHPEIETVLVQGELITAVTIPIVPVAFRSTYLKVRDREAYAFALASAAVGLEVTGGKVVDARVALGGVGTVPWRARRAEGALIGARPGEDTFKRAAELALHGAQAHTQNAFKIPLAKHTVVRALQSLMEARA
jgi:xanthine dehydrogenase YagS FAD-binding subunit